MKTNTTDKTITLQESELNQLRFIFNNLNSPSKDTALELLEDWNRRLAKAQREFHPRPVPEFNVD